MVAILFLKNELHTITALRPGKRGVLHMDQVTNDAELEPSLVFLSKAQVLKKVPVTGPTLWTWVRQGKFPRPRDISPNKTVWVASEVDEWMQSRPLRNYKP
jgi:prophage regulatory protein